MTPLVVLLAAVALSVGAPADLEYGNEEPPTPVIDIAEDEYLIEAELFANRRGWQDDSSRLPHRSEASNGYAVHLYKSESYTVEFCLPIEQSVWIENIYFSNDGWVDTVSVAVNGRDIGEFVSADESNWGNLWNEFNNTGSIGGEISLPSGRHSLTFTVKDGDQWGVELDAIKMRFSRPDVTVDLFCPDNTVGKNKTEGQNYPELPKNPTQTTTASFSSTDSLLTNSKQPTKKSPHPTSYPDFDYITKNPRCRLPWCHHNHNTGHTQPTRSTGLPVNPNYPDDPFCLTLVCQQNSVDRKQTYPPNSENTKTTDSFYSHKSTDETISDITTPTGPSGTTAHTDQDNSEHTYASGTSFSPYPSGSTSSRPYDPSNSNSTNPTDIPIFETTNPTYPSNSDATNPTVQYNSESTRHSGSTNNSQKTTTPSYEFSTDNTKLTDSSDTTGINPGTSYPSYPSQPAEPENINPDYSTSPLCRLPGCHHSTSAIKTSTESTDSASVAPVNPYFPDDPYCQTPQCKQSTRKTIDSSTASTDSASVTPVNPYFPEDPYCQTPQCKQNTRKTTDSSTASTGSVSVTPVNPYFPDDPYCQTPQCKQSSRKTTDSSTASTGSVSVTPVNPYFPDDPYCQTPQCKQSTRKTSDSSTTSTDNVSVTPVNPYFPDDPYCQTPQCKQSTSKTSDSSTASTDSVSVTPVNPYFPEDPYCQTPQCKQSTRKTSDSSTASTDSASVTPVNSYFPDDPYCQTPQCKQNTRKTTDSSIASTDSVSGTPVNPYFPEDPYCQTPQCKQSTRKTSDSSTESTDSVSVTPVNPYFPDDPYCQTPQCKRSTRKNSDSSTASTDSVSVAPVNPDFPEDPYCQTPQCKQSTSKTSDSSTASTDSVSVTPVNPYFPEDPYCQTPQCKQSTRKNSDSTVSGSTKPNNPVYPSCTGEDCEENQSSNKFPSTPTLLTDSSGSTKSPYITSTTSPSNSDCTFPDCKSSPSYSGISKPESDKTGPSDNTRVPPTDRSTISDILSSDRTKLTHSKQTTDPWSSTTYPDVSTKLENIKPITVVDPDCTSTECKQKLSNTKTTVSSSSTPIDPWFSSHTAPNNIENQDSTNTDNPKIKDSTTIGCNSPDCKQSPPKSTLPSDTKPKPTDSTRASPDCTSPECYQSIGTKLTTQQDRLKSTNPLISDSSSSSEKSTLATPIPTESINPIDPGCTAPDCKSKTSQSYPSQGNTDSADPWISGNTLPTTDSPKTDNSKPPNTDSPRPTDSLKTSANPTDSTDSSQSKSTKAINLVDPDCTSPECKQKPSKTTSSPNTKPTDPWTTGDTDSNNPESQQTDTWNSVSTNNPVSTQSTDLPSSGSTKPIPVVDPDCTSAECKQNPSSAKPIDSENLDISDSTGVNQSKPTVPSSTDPWYSTDTKTADSSNSGNTKPTENVFDSPKPTDQISGSSFDPECTSLECQQISSHGTKSTDKTKYTETSSSNDNTTPSNTNGSTITSSSDPTKAVNCNTPECRLSVATESTTKEQGSSNTATTDVTNLPDIQSGGNSPPLTDEVYQISCPRAQLLTVRRNDYLGCADDGKIRFDLYGARVSEVTFVIPTPFRIPKPSLRRLEARTQEKILWEDGYPHDDCDGSEHRNDRRQGISQPASDGSLPITINPSVTPSLTLSFRLSTTGVDLSKHLRPVFTMGICCTDPTNISMTAVETDTNTVIQLGEQRFHDKDYLKSWIFPFISGFDDRNIKVKINFNEVTERLVLNYMKFEIQEVDQKAHDAPTAPPTTVLCETKDVKVEGVKHEDPNKKKLKFRLNGSTTTSDVSSLLFTSPQTSDPKLVLDPSGKCSFNPVSPVHVDESAAFILGATDPNSSNPSLAIEEVELEPDVNEADNTSVILHLLGSTFGRTSLKLKISEKETTLTLLQLVPVGKPLSSFFLPCGREQTTIKADETDPISINDPWKSITGEQLTIRRR